MSNETNGRMVCSKDYVAGWLDSTVREFLNALPRKSKAIAYALITCLDSDRNPRSLLKKSPALKAIMQVSRTLGNGLLLPWMLLQESVALDQLLFGFDEIWFFPIDQIQPKPDSAWIVGPGRIDQAKLDKLDRWLTDNQCSLGLGDGHGLNVIVKAQGLAKYLIAHSILQREPGLQTDGFWKEDEQETVLQTGDGRSDLPASR